MQGLRLPRPQATHGGKFTVHEIAMSPSERQTVQRLIDAANRMRDAIDAGFGKPQRCHIKAEAEFAIQKAQDMLHDAKVEKTT